MMAAPSNDGGSPGDAGAGDVGSSTDVAADAACLAYDSGTSGAFQPGSPITGLTDQTWVRVDFPEAHCRSGSATGISVNANSASKKLVIFLEGGGACFNTLTCAANPSSATFGTPSGGILNRADMANPVRDWNFIDIPYCTGDVFAGNNPNGSVPGVGAQQFVGYTNMGAFLQRIVPTFPGLTQVLLTGVSAGGFGASANFGQVTRAFAPVPVAVLDDSGPSMRDPFLTGCLQQEQVNLWGFDKTVLAECGCDCPDITNYPIDAIKHGLKVNPNAPFALLDATGDSVIRMFYAFGLNNCTGTFSTNYPQQMYTDGLNDLRMQLSSYPNFGAYLFNDTRHTTLAGQYFDTQTAGGVMLTDWIKALVDTGKVTNVGP